MLISYFIPMRPILDSDLENCKAFFQQIIMFPNTKFAVVYYSNNQKFIPWLAQ